MKVLHIAASPKVDSESRSKLIGNAFVDAYLKQHANADCQLIDVHQITVPVMTTKLLKAFEGSAKQGTQEEKELQIYETLCKEFITADRYVISFPHWNLTAPPALVSYILAVARIGKAFVYTDEGPKGLLLDKKLTLIVSSGGICSDGNKKAACTAVDWLINLFSVCGIDDVQVIYCEGIEQMPDKTEEIIQNTIIKAQELGAGWDN